MLNEERVCEMARMAMFDQNEGSKCKPMISYFRKDYIAKEMLKSFVTGTLSFFMLLALGIMYSMEQLVEQINSIDLKQILIESVLAYAVFMAVYFLITYIVYNVRYSKGRQAVKRYDLHLRKVNKIYREEEQA